MTIKLEKELMMELVILAERFKKTEYRNVKSHYDNYVDILINFDCPMGCQDYYRTAWELMTKEWRE